MFNASFLTLRRWAICSYFCGVLETRKTVYCGTYSQMCYEWLIASTKLYYSVYAIQRSNFVPYASIRPHYLLSCTQVVQMHIDMIKYNIYYYKHLRIKKANKLEDDYKWQQFLIFHTSARSTHFYTHTYTHTSS